MFNTFVSAKQENALDAAFDELQAMTPAHMNSMLEKQPKEEAINLWKRRKTMVVQEVPRTAQGRLNLICYCYCWNITDFLFVLEIEPEDEPVRRPRATKRCRICRNPMKNHKSVEDCPRNLGEQQS